jgi:hypothetical protein
MVNGTASVALKEWSGEIGPGSLGHHECLAEDLCVGHHRPGPSSR